MVQLPTLILEWNRDENARIYILDPFMLFFFVFFAPLSTFHCASQFSAVPLAILMEMSAVLSLIGLE